MPGRVTCLPHLSNRHNSRQAQQHTEEHWSLIWSAHSWCVHCRFQECTLTDVSALDMVPPGRVMYLRRFKASPRAPVAKQQQHRQDARASKHLPNATGLPGLRQVMLSTQTSDCHDVCEIRFDANELATVVMYVTGFDCVRGPRKGAKIWLPDMAVVLILILRDSKVFRQCVPA